MNSKFLIILLLLSPQFLFGQSLPTDGTNYYTIIQSHQTDGDTESESSTFNAFEKWKWYWGPRLYPHGNFEAYSQTWEGSGSFTSSSSALPASNWGELGPTSEMVRNPGVLGASFSGIGRALDLAIVESNPSTMFVGTWGGGVWKTIDAGMSWQNYGTDKGLPILTIACIEIDQDNPDRMWVATGGKYRHDLASRGVFRTLDGGQTWEAVNNGLPDLSSIVLLSKLLIHPNDPNIMLHLLHETHFTSSGHIRMLHQ